MRRDIKGWEVRNMVFMMIVKGMGQREWTPSYHREKPFIKPVLMSYEFILMVTRIKTNSTLPSLLSFKD